jgi:hypothetical protein
MTREIDTRSRHSASASKRLKKQTSVTHVASTGVFTVAAGWLNGLGVNDIVRFSALTGGSSLSTSLDYYLTAPKWSLGATTFRASTLPDGPPLTGGSDITAGTVSTGDLTLVEDGVLSANYVSSESPAGR